MQSDEKWEIIIFIRLQNSHHNLQHSEEFWIRPLPIFEMDKLLVVEEEIYG